MPGKHVVRRHQVVVIAVRHRPHDRTAVQPRRQVRQLLANLDAGRRGVDRLKLAAHLGRGFRLHVERIVMTGGAGQKDNNNRLRLLRQPWLITRNRCPCLAGKQLRQSQTKHARAANLYGSTPGNAWARRRTIGWQRHEQLAIEFRRVCKAGLLLNQRFRITASAARSWWQAGRAAMADISWSGTTALPTIDKA